MWVQEQLDKARDALLNSKKQNHVLNDKLQNLLRNQDEFELRITELDKHIRSLQEVTDTQLQLEMPISSIIASASLSMSQESCVTHNYMMSSIRSLFTLWLC